MQISNVAALPDWLAELIDSDADVDLWVSFVNAPAAFSRVETIGSVGDVTTVSYPPGSVRALDEVAAYRVGPDGAVVAVAKPEVTEEGDDV